MTLSEAPHDRLLVLVETKGELVQNMTGFKTIYEELEIFIDICGLKVFDNKDFSGQVRLMDNDAMKFAVMNPIIVSI